MKLFDIDGPLMQLLTKITNLMFVNLITLVLLIPIVTGGAALTAMQYVVLKIARDEDYSLLKDYFKSFKDNFKQATAIWFIFLLIGIVLGGDFYIFSKVDELPYKKVFEVIITLVTVVAIFTFTFVFPILAKFDNPVKTTLKNSLIISVLQFPKTILMIIMYLLAVIIGMFSISILMRILPVFMFFGMSAPAYFGALMYSGFFYKLEDQIYQKYYEEHPEEYDSEGNYIGKATEEVAENIEEDDERIFHDKLDESIEVDEKKFY